ncbi:MAG: transglutaminase-like cysteine peptidase [Alphaproteobacteria bacterium]|nr:transglutaminase-like cysteine peptidase [Alphaproteobacteria bacterium]
MSKTGILKKIRYFLSHNKLGELLVMQELITPCQLNQSLKLQQETHKPLGEVFITLGFISKNQLSGLLLRQRLLRFTTASILCFSSFSGFTRPARASETNSHSSANLVLASTKSTHFDDLNVYPALFGANEKQSTNLKAFTKWLGMFERLDKELHKKRARRTIKAMKIELSEYRSKSIFEMAKHVDRMMNKKKYIIDQKNWDKSDYWATPVEFLKHGGDCEDFAIAKYVALHALGVPESRIRMAIVQDLKKNMPHAVLIVYTEKGPYVLDNQSKIMRSADTIKHYKPIYSINRHAWWLHTTPDSIASNAIVASAK